MMASAAITNAKPSQPMIPKILGHPRHRSVSTDFRGQEEAETDEAQVVNEVRRVEDAFREVLEVADDRQVGQHAAHRRPGEGGHPVDDPEEQEHAETDYGARDDLVLRQARDEKTDRDEAPAEQQGSR